ncbi:MAG: hypothetical protein AAFR81_03535 [Chloroflexota bacterium]
MGTKKQEFQAHNSPWTEVYAMHCEREQASAEAHMSNAQAEIEPTRNALADVYNRDETVTHSKRF